MSSKAGAGVEKWSIALGLYERSTNYLELESIVASEQTCGVVDIYTESQDRALVCVLFSLRLVVEQISASMQRIFGCFFFEARPSPRSTFDMSKSLIQVMGAVRGSIKALHIDRKRR